MIIDVVGRINMQAHSSCRAGSRLDFCLPISFFLLYPRGTGRDVCIRQGGAVLPYRMCGSALIIRFGGFISDRFSLGMTLASQVIMGYKQLLILGQYIRRNRVP